LYETLQTSLVSIGNNTFGLCDVTLCQKTWSHKTTFEPNETKTAIKLLERPTWMCVQSATWQALSTREFVVYVSFLVRNLGPNVVQVKE